MRDLVETASNPGSSTDMMLIWLQGYLDPGSLKVWQEKRAAKREYFTESETNYTKTVDSLACILLFALENNTDVKLWNLHTTQIYEILEKQTQLIDRIEGSEPAFQSTLHLLYTSYDLVTLVDTVVVYMWKIPCASEMKQNLDHSIDSAKKRLRERILSKSSIIKKALDESGWMDRVLDCLALDCDSERVADQDSTVSILTEVVGENFMEDWAGHVVESWKDSVIGFSYFKSS